MKEALSKLLALAIDKFTEKPGIEPRVSNDSAPIVLAIADLTAAIREQTAIMLEREKRCECQHTRSCREGHDGTRWCGSCGRRC